MMTYLQKLKNPKWQKKRLEILNRDEFTCQLCKDKTTTLHIHHKLYNTKNPWETDNFLLETLCEDCHNFLHKSGLQFNEIDTICKEKLSSKIRFIVSFSGSNIYCMSNGRIESKIVL